MNITVDRKLCLITGASNGIGFATALGMAERGYDLVLLGRNEQKLAKCSAAIRAEHSDCTVSSHCGDLGSLADVNRLASEFIATGRPLDCLISNAGVTNMKRLLTVDGYEEMFAVNHLAPFLLINRLLPAVQKAPAARIVVVSSGAHGFVKGMNFSDLNHADGFASMKVYGHSKLANILFTRQLAENLSNDDVTVNCCHPGAVATGLGTNNGFLGKAMMGMLKPFFRTPAKGAETSLYLACADEVANSSGGYYYNCKRVDPKPWAQDAAAAQQLWDISSEMVGL